jgi:hypothetical protein
MDLSTDKLLGLEQSEAEKILKDAGFYYRVTRAEVPEVLTSDFVASRVTLFVDHEGIVSKVIRG